MTKLMLQFRTLKTINLDIYRAVWPDRVELYCLRANPGWSNGFSISMKTIELTQGQVALVDDEDYELVNQYKWFAEYRKLYDSWYAFGLVNKKQIAMHRFIMGVTDPKIKVDHRFHNTLDNRKEQLRTCTNAQNMANQRKQRRVTSSQFKGVSWNKLERKWKAYVMKNKKTYCLGSFENEVDAAIAYNMKAIELFGEFACLNQIDREMKTA